MFKRLADRKNHIGLFFLIVFGLMLFRLATITIVEGDSYLEKSVNNRLKKIAVYAKRGEIYDRNGVLLAGNIPAFTLDIMASSLEKTDLNRVSVDLMTMLDSKGEGHLEFPIRIEDGNYTFRYDDDRIKWLLDRGYPDYFTAKAVLDDYRAKEQLSETLNDQEAYSIMIQKGIILPISISKLKFWNEIEKENFLKMYGLEQDVTAKDAFDLIRSRREFAIDDKYSDEEAYKILIVSHALKEKGYLKYEPIKIASNISKESAIQISERAMDLPGVNVGVEPIRSYPFKNVASHILGYIGKISSEAEISKYVNDNGYDKNQLIGKVGIEGHFELDLHGENGYRYIEVDALGKMVRELDDGYYGLNAENSSAGEDIRLTTDIELQQTLEAALKHGIEQINIGGTFTSQYGNYNYSEAYPNARTGAAIAVDVKTGEVLAMASYPDYDLNLFSTGITYKDWDKLSPENPNDPLAPRPLFNIATMTGVQPGSVYKMSTGFAAMEHGLNPYQKLYSDGYIEIGGTSFGCWYWNGYRGKHGLTDFFRGLETSCNYYFFNISSGYDHRNQRPLNYTMSTSDFLEKSKLLGFDEKTGMEIEEVSYGIPNPEQKRIGLERSLKSRLGMLLPDYFPAALINTEEKEEAVLTTIIGWSEENPSRGTIINRLKELGVDGSLGTPDRLADIVKFDYFNQMMWHQGDTFNLSIGQGDHKYTVAQLARYIMIIANDGYPYELTLVQSVGSEAVNKNAGVERIALNNTKTFEHLRTAMLQVTQGANGTAKSVFRGFPVGVGAKTGTAQNQGKIPPADEVAYFKTYLKRIDSALSQSKVDEETAAILIDRNEEVAQIRKQMTGASKEALPALESKLSSLISQGYLTEASAMRAAIKSLSSRGLTDAKINEFRKDYDNFAWFVSFAPYEDPQIAVVVMVPQGGHGGYAGPIAREIIGKYLGIGELNVGTSSATGAELNSN
ncbi:penicillin-binding transpeptidase domain-containing protein [Acidaminobacter hydrogenoformans]|uniref:Penicillin-binding protein 2 n=1 Tax=Acidaminobacter hydrogenoformans DSM 2784 TaxID=1120920 RepID=A0A1G5RV52_9FIRM|nr:penicillin-binding transpeptidase domain-containing protein [Acidaminobacter hydrogenoformans]SCZ77209.1 penicillin-binding protein 2 [Acidaminobacter hydrogenoformans DSM 2784]